MARTDTSSALREDLTRRLAEIDALYGETHDADARIASAAEKARDRATAARDAAGPAQKAALSYEVTQLDRTLGLHRDGGKWGD